MPARNGGLGLLGAPYVSEPKQSERALVRVAALMQPSETEVGL